MNRNNIYNNPHNNIYKPQELYGNPPLNYIKPVPEMSETYINEFKKEHNTPYHNEQSYQYPSNILSSTNNLPKSFNKTNTLTSGQIGSNQYEKPKTLYDNLAPVLMNKEVIEYPIIIDSADRDYIFYTNPYEFRVSLNTTNSTRTPYIYKDFENIKFIKLTDCTIPRYYRQKRVNQEFNSEITANVISNIDTTWSVNIGNVYPLSTINGILEDFSNREQNINGNLITYLTVNFEGYISSNISGIIKTEFTSSYYKSTLNTKYTNGNLTVTNYQMDYIINGNTSVIYVYDSKLTSNNTYYIIEDTRYDIFTERYIVLHMNEITNINENSTNDSIRKSFAVLYPNKINKNYIYFYTDGIERFYKNSELQNLKNMTFYLEDVCGNKLSNPYVNTNMYKPIRNSIITYDKITGLEIIDYTDSATYIRHPFYKYGQMTLQIKLGIYENDIDKNLFSYNKKQ